MSNRKITRKASQSLPDNVASGCSYDDWLDRLALIGGYTAPPRTVRQGEVYQLGVHRLCCGNSTSRADVDRLMNGAKADFVFTSPPFLNQRTYKDEKRSHPHSDPVGCEPIEDFNLLMRGVVDCLPTKIDAQIIVNLGQVIKDGEIVDYFDDWKKYMKSSGFKHRDTYVWDKGIAKPFIIWRLMRQHEFLLHYSKDTRVPHKTVKKKPSSIDNDRKYYINRWPDGQMRRQENNIRNSAQTHKQEASIFTVSPMAGEDRSRREFHPAVFPLELCRRIIPIWTSPGEVVYEPFLGSGTTLLVCEELQRRCFGIEISPQYCAHILDEWERKTGRKAEKVL